MILPLVINELRSCQLYQLVEVVYCECTDQLSSLNYFTNI